MAEDSLEVGCRGLGHLHLRNVGADLIEFQTDQPLLANVLDPATLESVARYSGPVAGMGRMIHLEPGGEVTIAVLIGTSSTSNGEVIELSPGPYVIRVDVPIYELRPDGDGYELSHLTMPLSDLVLTEKRIGG